MPKATYVAVTEQVATGAISSANIASGAVTTEKITDLSVTTAKINDSAVTTSKINDSAVTTSKIADLSVTDAKISAVYSSVYPAGVGLNSGNPILDDVSSTMRIFNIPSGKILYWDTTSQSFQIQ